MLALIAISAAPLYAQETAPGACATPEFIAVTGNSRVDTAAVRSTAGLSTGTQLNVHDIQTAIKALYATGQFDDVQIVCRVSPSDNKASVVIQVKERPILTDYKVIGADRVSPKDVKEKLAFPTGSPVDPGKIAKAIASTDSLYESKGYYLASVKPESTLTDGKLSIKFNVDEGKRLAISGIRINGNKSVSDADIVAAMDTKPEGFLFTRNGELDDAKYAQDLSEKIPQLYASRGYIDFRILKDTLIVDRAKGKGLLDVTVSEGPRYTVGNFEVLGNRHDTKVGLNSFILTTRDGKPRFLADDISEFLFAEDLKGDGVKQTLWTQRYSPGTFFTPAQADQVVVKNGKLVVEKPVQVPAGFRPMGAAFANVMGKNVRSLAFIDAQNRLQISNEGEELWRSATSVGGGYMQVEHDYTWSSRTSRSKFYKIEPTPLAIDLDGDGIDEILVPQNLIREGLLAVVFKGPAGFRLQSVNTGFEGGITALGGYRTDDSTQPTVIAAVVRFNSLLKTSGETQIIMTVPQE